MANQPSKTWETFIPIIVSVGLNAAEYIWQRWSSGADLTADDWLRLKAMGQQTPEGLARVAAGLAGVSDERLQQILALLQPPSP